MRLNKLVYGVGTNDANYVVRSSIDGQEVGCPYYRTWRNMLRRCSEPSLKRYPAYQGCEVCKEWLLFSNFKSWMEQQDWQGKQLDKDFLGDGKLYSPKTCCFVEGWLNTLFTDRRRARGKWPLGVDYHKQTQKFRAILSVNSTGKHLGYFDTPEEAHKIYLKAKREYVQNKMQNYPNTKIKQAILARVQNDIN